MNEVMAENKRLVEPLQRAKEEVEELRKELSNYEKDKQSLTVRIDDSIYAVIYYVWRYAANARIHRLSIWQNGKAMYESNVVYVFMKCNFVATDREGKTKSIRGRFEVSSMGA